MTLKANGQTYVLPAWVIVAFLVLVPIVMGGAGMFAFAAASRGTVAATPIVEQTESLLEVCPNGLLDLSYSFDVRMPTTARVSYTVWNDAESQNVVSMTAGDQIINNWPRKGVVEERDVYRLPNTTEDGEPFLAGSYRLIIGVTAEGHRTSQAEVPFMVPETCVGVKAER